MNYSIQFLQERIQDVLSQYLQVDTVASSPTLIAAMQYAVLNGGKKIRPLLVYCTGLCFNTPLEALDNVAAAVEFIHCYSLVHDDLPAMDDDDFRRGKPSCHRAFDEATAILVGDGLQAYAFELLAQVSTFFSEQQSLKMIAHLANAIGPCGMVGGQVLDLQTQKKDLSVEQLEKIHLLKTAALIRASIYCGAVASNCEDKNILKILDQFGTLFGLFFQMRDDLEDASQDQSSMQHSNTSILSVEPVSAVKQKLQDLYQRILVELKQLDTLNLDTKILSQLLDGFCAQK